MCLGEGAGDVAYLLATALKPEIRHCQEMDLLRHYQKCLATEGVDSPQTGHLLERYRAHLVYPLEAMPATLAVGGLMDISTNQELIHRSAAAAADQNAFCALQANCRG